MNFLKNVSTVAWLSCFTLMFSVGATSVRAGEPKLEVRLVWGTNTENTPDTNYKELEPSFAKKLGMFKWKKFYTVNRQDVSLAPKAPQKIRLSPQCEIELQHLSGQRYEINVFGEGKHVRKITERITKQDSLVIAGDDKNDCAWFILIREN